MVFFVGDSFTPTGMDDYCLLNRNFLAPEKGFLDCLKAIKRMTGEYLLINEHVLPAFRFSPQQVDRMIQTFEERRQLLAARFPWDDPKVVFRDPSGFGGGVRGASHVPASLGGAGGSAGGLVGSHQEGSVSIP